MVVDILADNGGGDEVTGNETKMAHFQSLPNQQKSTNMWLVQKGKVSTLVKPSTTILPSPKSTHEYAPNLVPSSPDHLGRLDLTILCQIKLLYELLYVVQDVPRPLMAGNILDPTFLILNI